MASAASPSPLALWPSFWSVCVKRSLAASSICVIASSWVCSVVHLRESASSDCLICCVAAICISSPFRTLETFTATARIAPDCCLSRACACWTTADSILICTGTTSLPFAASAGARPA